MEYKQLYFIKNTNYLDSFGYSHLIFFIIFLILFIISIFYTITLHKYKKEPEGTNSLMFSIFTFFVLAFLGWGNISIYNSHIGLVKIIDNKEYSSVEGKVKNYDSMQITEKKHESFSVNGIKFIYRPAYNTGTFSMIKGQGNPIKEGSFVRLWYFQNNDLKTNLILKFEYVP